MKKNKHVMLRILGETKRVRWGLFFAAILGAIGIVCALIAPKIVSQIINDLNDVYLQKTQDAPEQIFRLLAILAGVYLFGAFIEYAKQVLMSNLVSKGVTRWLRVNISSKISKLPVSYVDKTPIGEVQSRAMNDVSSVGNSVHQVINVFVLGSLRLIITAVMVFLTDPIIAIIILLCAPLSLVASALIASKCEKYYKTAQKENGKLYSTIEESYNNYLALKAYNLEQDRLQKHAQSLQTIRQSRAKADFIAGTIQPVVVFLNALVYILICLVGGYFVIYSTLSLGAVVALILYAREFSAPLESMANFLGQYKQIKVSADRVFEYLDAPEMPEQIDSGAQILGGDVSFENVDFSYDPEKPLIKNLNLSVKQGQKIAIVGATGGGKTTIVNLMMRFYDVDAGKIIVGGADIATIPRERVREAFSMVLQDTWLFSGTIMENVAFGAQDVSKEQIKEACMSAYCDGFITALPNGYDTKIQESASNLSSGQKQLLTIARALLSAKDLLILDEATSNVDTRTEILIQQAMDKLMQGKTAFVIAHRLSTIKNADKILFVHQGQILEQGTHAELLAQKGHYYNLYQSQYNI